MTKIEWTETTLFGPAMPRRCRVCKATKKIDAFPIDRSRADGHGYVCIECRHPENVDDPSKRRRRKMAAQGLRWCVGCKTWLALALVDRRSHCRSCHNRIARERYASDAQYRFERRQHAYARKRGIESVPQEGAELLMHEFGGQCAYCNAPATTWDHVVPISKGGRTTPDNILPACAPCNSSKKDQNVWNWIDKTGRFPQLKTFERLAHYQVL